MSDYLVVFVTVGKPGEAEAIARDLVENRLAACVNLVPQIKSIYRWKGEICQDEEILLVIKTERQRFDALAERVKDLHSYEVPEIVALPIEAGSQSYLDWIMDPVSR